jgi:hypothetical protein
LGCSATPARCSASQPIARSCIAVACPCGARDTI